MSDLVLHDYQEVARDFLTRVDRAALWLDMGLGKTAICLSTLEDRHLPVLVVAPKRVAEDVWDVEVDLWRPDLTIAVAKGSPAQRAQALRSNADITAIGRDNLADALDARPWRTIIMDESSAYKNRSSGRWTKMREMVTNSNTKYVWELTGTPSPNGLMNVWAQIFLLDNGARLGRNITTYRRRYFYANRSLPNGVVIDWQIRPEAEDNIHALLADIALSMKSEGNIELPPVTHNEVKVSLPSKVRKVYNTMAKDLVVDLEMLGGGVHTAAQAGQLTNKLSQIAAGFMFEDPIYEEDDDGEPIQVNKGAYIWLHDEKIKAVREIVNGAEGSPVLVFYRYRPELEHLKAEFGKDAHTIHEKDAVKRWNRGEIPVLLAHPASAGHGLNLQHGGHTAVWSTLDWDLELWEQGNARLPRQGQKHPVVIHRITATPACRLIYNALTNKAVVQDALMDYLESPI